MKKLLIDFDEVQKAMEDINREAFDYFLDTNTGDVVILSGDIIERANYVLSERIEADASDYEEIEFDEVREMPDWMEEEIELAIEIFLDKNNRYLRIPERNSDDGFTVMKRFIETLQQMELKEELTGILDGRGAFRRFKDAIDAFPKEKKAWYGFNAKAVKVEIQNWLESSGIEPLLRKGDVPQP